MPLVIHAPRTHGSGRRALSTAIRTALLLVMVYALAVLTPWGQEMENSLLKRDELAAVALQPPPPAPDGSPAAPAPLGNRPPSEEFPTIVILSSEHAALAGGLLLVVALVQRRCRQALWGLVTLAGSAVMALALKVALPRPALDPTSHGLATANSAPSGHVAMATALVIVALVVCPASWRYAVGALGTTVAVLTAYFVQLAGWHRPSDIVLGAGVSLLCALMASYLVPADGNPPEEGAGRRPSWIVAVSTLTACFSALGWAWGEQPAPGFLVVLCALAPCAAAVVFTLRRLSGAGAARPAHP
ncbi:phosphatase PAP2 family protein [Streptomyces sp. NPDC057101]|uniref:phosphatase PAP2 family protein n=1 Tax=Streptomyces sp. NPDC057101 TaxID=3346020 RepID=UPI003645C216